MSLPLTRLCIIALETRKNIKFVLYCGHSEFVHNADGTLLIKNNVFLDMAAYNYYDPSDRKIIICMIFIHYKSFGYFGWGYGNVPK